MQNLDIDNSGYVMEVQNAIEGITSIYQDHNFFWKNATGWAPDEANAILSKSRLDWLQALSESLYLWIETYKTTTDNDGKLILAWANLGALLEGGLKLFLSIYYVEYKNSSNHKKDRRGNLKAPDTLQMEELKVFIQQEKIFDKDWINFIALVQQRRNAIHAYKDREIGDWNEFFNNIIKLYNFTKIIKERLPYPY